MYTNIDALPLGTLLQPKQGNKKKQKKSTPLKKLQQQYPK